MNQDLVSNDAQSFSGFLVLLVVSLLAVYLESNGGVNWTAETVVIAVLCLAFLCIYILFCANWSATGRRNQWLIALGFICFLPLYLLVSISFIAIFSIVWIVMLTDVYGSRTGSRFLVFVLLYFSATQFYHLWDEGWLEPAITSVTLGMFHLFALGATHRAIREQQLREHTATLNRELLATRGLLSQSSRQTERLRIARDLHDLLGHHMTALILNLEVAKHKTSGESRDQVQQSLALAKLLLSDLRAVVSELREDDTIDLEQAVKSLIADLPGLHVALDFSAAPQIKDFQTAETLLRCIQEAVTNVLRHSNGTQCHVTLRLLADNIELVVQDDGVGVADPVPGNGLNGMRERVQALAGQVSWQQLRDGFQLRVLLPESGA